MGSLRVDPDQLRALAPEFEDIAAEAQRAVAELKATIAREGACWGNDEPGKAFEKTYLGDSKKGVEALEQTVENLRALGQGVRGTADTFENQDQQLGNFINNSTDPNGLLPNGLQPAGNWPQQQMPPANGAVPQQVAPGATPGATPGSRSGTPDRTNGQQQPGDQSGKSSDKQGDKNSGDKSKQPGDGKPGDKNGRTPGSDNPVSAQPGSAPGRKRASAPKTGAPAPVPWDKKEAASRKAAQSKPADSPWSRPGSSKPGGATAPGNQGAGRDAQPSTPRGPSNPWKPQPKKQAAAAQAKPGAPKSAKAAPAKPPAAVPTEELQERHDVELVGFDTPTLDESVLGEIAAALADMLAKYPVAEIRRVGVAALPDAEPTRLEWDWVEGETGPEPYTRCILFNVDYVREPSRFAELVDADLQRPVYATAVREFGHALDVTGAFLARRSAQQVLISTYLGADPDRPRDTLPHVVSGYKNWRAELSDRCFHNGRFDPGAALAEGFTEVEMRGEEASAPAVALHKLLVDTASRPPSGASAAVFARRPDDPLRVLFEDEFAAAVAGRPLRVHPGIGPEADRALVALALAGPRDDLIANARAAYSRTSADPVLLAGNPSRA
ncbi:MAG: hypothetical protein HOQ24_08370 [Mycobacteriaceae bacterium]|nr:hypothetical protein [Mycobacteriaceae bacterium]